MPAPHPLITQLRNARLSRGWTLRHVADEVGVAVVTVQAWELGYRQPGFGHLARWAAVLGRDLTATPRLIALQGEAS